VATRVEGFRTLDWERDTESLAGLFGVDAQVLADRASTEGPPLAVWRQALAATRARASAYEGFFRCTRPHPTAPGRFLFEHARVRRDPIGVMRMSMSSLETWVEGWLMPLQGLVYVIASDPVAGTMMFGIFNGVGASKVEVFDGLIVIPGSDLGRAPSAMPMLCERIGDLSGDRDEDDRTFEAMRLANPLAPPGSVPEHIQAHLARDFGPSHLAEGGDWLLSMSLARTLSRGPDYDSAPAGA
jgi:hypothetical protein